ncbi:hypothetical protein V8C35DRAFT_289377 [Trichoderma chlorosporum]
MVLDAGLKESPPEPAPLVSYPAHADTGRPPDDTPTIGSGIPGFCLFGETKMLVICVSVIAMQIQTPTCLFTYSIRAQSHQYEDSGSTRRRRSALSPLASHLTKPKKWAEIKMGIPYLRGWKKETSSGQYRRFNGPTFASKVRDQPTREARRSRCYLKILLGPVSTRTRLGDLAIWAEYIITLQARAYRTRSGRRRPTDCSYHLKSVWCLVSPPLQ